MGKWRKNTIFCRQRGSDPHVRNGEAGNRVGFPGGRETWKLQPTGCPPTAEEVMDIAPTGHTLLLLDATGSYHRDIIRHASADTQGRIVTSMMRLQDPEQTKVLVVTLPETTPVLETARL